MKIIKTLFTLLFALMVTTLSAQPQVEYTDAQDLTFLGKLSQTTNPYHRIELADYPELSKAESALLRETAGEMVLFRTNSTTIWIKAKYGRAASNNSTPRTASEGYTLYIQRDGEWVWASSAVNPRGADKQTGEERLNRPLRVIANMDTTMKECLVYLPIHSELFKMEIGVDKGAVIEKVENPFRHKIAIFGSSFTHGVSASASGMTYPAYFSRQTGLYVCALGMSGNSRLQPYLARYLAQSDVDAIVCDAFSNPSIDQISTRLRPFIEIIREKKPSTPIIFLSTIYREKRNFDLVAERDEQARIDYVNEIMAEVVKEYNDVYFINVPNQTGTDHETSADGVHPFSWGYKRWADAIERPLLKILKKYGIK